VTSDIGVQAKYDRVEVMVDSNVVYYFV